MKNVIAGTILYFVCLVLPAMIDLPCKKMGGYQVDENLTVPYWLLDET
ncbi:MAG TPA: hypothetical protein PK165_02110 [bacterium]|nr:hypothetical protein [bacterium]HOL49619.1 hypothetical protein [bacterium]HPO51611.1 hypothetical protein [bacterium]